MQKSSNFHKNSYFKNSNQNYHLNYGNKNRKQIKSQSKYQNQKQIQRSGIFHSNLGPNQILNKQSSYNFLDKTYFIGDKNQHGLVAKNLDYHLSLKLDDKLHLPSLVNKNNLEQISNYQKQIPMTVLAPHKTIKIPIQKLKPLKPEQIKLKYQKKIKQEQRNRAKDIAIQIFNRQQEQEEKNKFKFNQDILDQVEIDSALDNKLTKLNIRINNKNNEKQKSDFYIKKSLLVNRERQNPERTQTGYQIEQPHIRTTIKKQKSINYLQKGEKNIFKKHLLKYNQKGNVNTNLHGHMDQNNINLINQ